MSNLFRLFADENRLKIVFSLPRPAIALTGNGGLPLPPELANVSLLSRVRDVERCAGKPHAPFIEGLASQEAGLLYQSVVVWEPSVHPGP